MNRFKKSEGFTLIELLIVITIIGILAVALVPRITGGPAKARDATRKADLQQIATAIEMYTNDHSGNYPSSDACISDLASDLGDYLTSVPDDPDELAPGFVSGCSGYEYVVIDDPDGGTDIVGYVLIADLEGNDGTAAGGVYVNKPSTIAAVDSATSPSDVSSNLSGKGCDETADCKDDSYGAVYILVR